MRSRLVNAAIGGEVSAKAIASEVLSNAITALAKASGRELSSELTESERAGLEAIVQVTGRPALRYPGGKVETPDELGENDRWRVLIVTARNKMNSTAASVGRVSRSAPSGDDQLLGTAWRLGDEMVVTNRHVAAYLVVSATAPVASWRLEPRRKSRVDFSPDANSLSKFAVRDLVYCAPEEEIDLAILRLDCSAALPPPPLPLDWSPDSLGYEIHRETGQPPQFKGAEIYVVGHPYKKNGSNAIAQVFDNADGAKRCSPGFVTAVGRLEFEHDCSTLGGNSGSCVFSTSNHAVVGLHFAGLGVDLASGRGRSNAALAFARLAGNPATAILGNRAV
jgi:hypothetical protein